MNEQPLPDSYDYWYQQGSEQIDTGEYEEAIASLNRAMEIDSAQFRTW